MCLNLLYRIGDQMSEEFNEYTSNIDRWPGKIYLPLYMNFKTLIAWEKAVRTSGLTEKTVDLEVMQEALLPLICKLVKKWEIEGLPENLEVDDFPGSPSLLSWVIECSMDLFTKTNGNPDPNLPGLS